MSRQHDNMLAVIDERKKAVFVAAISEAKKRVGAHPFIASCERFFLANGYLSDKQLAALAKYRHTFRVHITASRAIDDDNGNIYDSSEDDWD